MPHSSKEPKIHPNVPGPRDSAGTPRTSQTPRPSAPVPGPRPGPRPAPPRADSGRPAPGGTAPARTAVAPRPAARKRSSPEETDRSAPQIQLVTATDATAVETADETIDGLLDGGCPPADILVLTTGEPHPWAQHELSFGEDAYWSQQTDGQDVFYAHAETTDRVSARSVVVLVVNGGTDEQAARALPAALSRANTRLIVCGDPQRLRSLL
ncbi:hypothetical protein F0L17_19945 [Streptomyces sp. TRM43335]|uniref:Uncharacterized protein n=1 Tax=Streptomyces taklimakanensis TaxID=2569853 RepID=A0A6G2BGL4_9ACTN|nr:hypothetical protein [Streptomyces taklimakanensis]MTE21344.1 hypothetical protein [Streptomyces taklimakanensis]